MTLKFSVSAPALIVIGLALSLGVGETLALVLIAALVHEIGHYLAIKLCCGEVSAVRLALVGFTMYTRPAKTYSHEILTALAGPVMSALLAFSAGLIARKTGLTQLYELSGISLIFCIFNLMPVLPLDGGKTLLAAAAYLFGTDTASHIVCIVSCAVIFLLLALGFYVLLITKQNFTLLLAALWLLISYCKSR